MTLGKSPSFCVLLLPHLSRAAACSPPPTEGHEPRHQQPPSRSPRKSQETELSPASPDTLTTPWLPGESC